MGVKGLLLKAAGKEELQLDSRIGMRRIVRLCIQYGFMLARGTYAAFGRNNISSGIFVGRGVKLYEKRLMSIGSKTKIHSGVKIDALSTEGVRIGCFSVLGRGTVIECTGGLALLGKGLIIGDRSTFGNECFFGAAGGIEIGDDVVAGQYVRFHSENHNYDDQHILIREQGVTHKGIRIGNNCWIGSGAVFLDGASLGDGCVVAANAVVTRAFPDNSVVGGVPARILKMRGSSEGHV